MIRLVKLCLACCVFLCSQLPLPAGELGHSSIEGLAALNWIVNDPGLQVKMSIGDNQLAEIETILREKKHFIGSPEQNESIARGLMKRLLSSKQFDIIRIEFLKTKAGSPLGLFQPIFLAQFGIDAETANNLGVKFAQRHAENVKKIDELRVEVIKDSLPIEAQYVLWAYVGKDFVADQVDLDSKSLYPESSAEMELLYGYNMEIPASVRLSREQLLELDKSSAEVRQAMTQGRAFTRAELEARLNAILRKGQRFAIQQSLNQHAIRGDLMRIVDPFLTKKYNLSETRISELRENVVKAKQQIKDTELKLQIQACREVLKDAPPQVQEYIKNLTRGVWDI